MRLAYDVSPKIAGTLSRQTFDGDVRHYLRLGGSGLLATRLRGFKSTGDFPDFLYFGGNSELRGYDYLEFAGQNTVFANAELRFPLIEAALTPIGVIGGIRGVFFAGVGGSWFNNQATQNPCTGESTKFRFANSRSVSCQVPVGVKLGADGQAVFVTDPVTGLQSPVLNYATQNVSGFRLQDGRASYGLGLETFALGFPIHFDWSWRTLFNKGWEEVVFACGSLDSRNGSCVSGAAQWRKPRFAVWIGYDF
jgi:outer membrane protein assembly factor BamA